MAVIKWWLVVALTLLQLSCWASHLTADSSERSVISLGEEPDFEATTGLNMARIRSAVAGKDGETIKAMRLKAEAEAIAKQTVGTQTTALDTKLRGMSPADTPIDVMLDPSGKPSSILSAVKQPSGLPNTELSKAEKMNKELEKDQEEQEAGAAPTDAIQKMELQIRKAVRTTVLNAAKTLPPGATSWDSVIPSERDVRQATASGLSPPMQQLEMAAAERQALHRREHAVQKAEENIAFMEHSADYKVRQAHHAAQAMETQELQKAAAMEEKAEAQESKSRADEQNAITVASSEKKEVANLKGENKKLRDKLKRMTQKEEQAVKEVTSEKVKMAAAAKHAVQTQAMEDKLKAQSELSTMAGKAKGLSAKDDGQKAVLEVKQHEIARLREHIAKERDFSKVEVKQAIAQAHLVSHKLWQGKVADMAEKIVDLKILQKAKLKEQTKATKDWALTAAQLKVKLDQQQSAADLNSETDKQIKKTEAKLVDSAKQLQKSHHKIEIHKAEAAESQAQLVKQQVENKENKEAITKLRAKESEMRNHQEKLKMSAQKTDEKLAEVEKQLKTAKEELAKSGPHGQEGLVPPQLATSADFISAMGDQEELEKGHGKDRTQRHGGSTPPQLKD